MQATSKNLDQDIESSAQLNLQIRSYFEIAWEQSNLR